MLRKFWRSLNSQQRLGRYLLYAIGEIILIVLGILIALQVNLWNETRKKENLKVQYLEALHMDLRSDTSMINSKLKYYDRSHLAMMELIARLSSTEANRDTVIKIARYEFKPSISGVVDFHDNTYRSMLATGDISLFDLRFYESLISLYESRDHFIQYNHINMSSYMNKAVNFTNHYTYNAPSHIDNSAPLNDRIWEEADLTDLVSRFNGLVSTKISAIKNAHAGLSSIKNETRQLLDTMRSHYPRITDR